MPLLYHLTVTYVCHTFGLISCSFSLSPPSPPLSLCLPHGLARCFPRALSLQGERSARSSRGRMIAGSVAAVSIVLALAAVSMAVRQRGPAIKLLQMGPLHVDNVQLHHLERAMFQSAPVVQAKQQSARHGAKLAQSTLQHMAAGVNMLAAPSPGTFVAPTVGDGPTVNSPLLLRSIFNPIVALALQCFVWRSLARTEDEAVSLVPLAKLLSITESVSFEGRSHLKWPALIVDLFEEASVSFEGRSHLKWPALIVDLFEEASAQKSPKKLEIGDITSAVITCMLANSTVCIDLCSCCSAICGVFRHFLTTPRPPGTNACRTKTTRCGTLHSP